MPTLGLSKSKAHAPQLRQTRAPQPGDMDGLKAEVTRFFAFANFRFWNGQLPPVTFGFYPQAPRGRRLGHYRADAWTGTEAPDEIAITVDTCLRYGPAWIYSTVLHEMVHHWQQHFGFQRPPIDAYHHNAEWWIELERVGLEPDTTGKRSHGWTKPGPSFTALLRAFKPALDQFPTRRATRASTKGKMAKWVCACGYALRIGKAEVRIKCLDCKKRFAKVEVEVEA